MVSCTLQKKRKGNWGGYRKSTWKKEKHRSIKPAKQTEKRHNQHCFWNWSLKLQEQRRWQRLPLAEGWHRQMTENKYLTEGFLGRKQRAETWIRRSTETKGNCENILRTEEVITCKLARRGVTKQDKLRCHHYRRQSGGRHKKLHITRTAIGENRNLLYKITPQN